VRRVLRSSSGYIHTVDEMPAQEPAIGDTGRNASLPGVPSFGLRYAFTKSYAKSCKEHIRHNLPSEAPLLFKRKENKQRYNFQSETQLLFRKKTQTDPVRVRKLNFCSEGKQTNISR
jgi:hypothetical protein